jgi:anti-anti-sigma factor
MVQVSGERLRIRAERRDRICVVSLKGPLDSTAGTGLTECIRTAQAARPARLVIDMSGVSSVDFGGARAFVIAARPVQGQCPVIVRSLRSAARRQLELTGLDLDWLDSGRPAQGGPQPRAHQDMADSVTGILVREWRHLLGSAEHAITDGRQTAQSIASTEDTEPAVPARVRPPYAASGTVGRAVAFIEERARDDVGVTDIAAAAFVTVRAVQLAFRRYLDITPLGFLRQVRLEHAHQELAEADPDRTTVTAIAAGWRFTNASRFSAYYRAAYGVPPTQTLRQRPAGP